MRRLSRMTQTMAESSTPSRSSILLAFAALYVLWGSTYLGIRFLLEGGFTPFLGAGLRMTVAGALLWSFRRLRGASLPAPRQLLELAVAGCFLFVGGNGLVMVAQQSLPSGLVATLVATTPFWLTGLEVLLPGGERPGVAAWLGIALGFGGVAILVGPRLGTGAGATAALLCLIAPVLWSIGGLWAKHRLRKIEPFTVSAFEMLFAGMALLVLGAARGEAAVVAPIASGWWALVYLISFGSLIGFSAFVFLMAHVPAAKVATYSYVNPVIAVFLGWALAGEELGARSLLATLVIVAGVALVNLTAMRRAARVPLSTE